MTTLTLPAGEYFIGDPCYVLQAVDGSDNHWDRFLDLMWSIPEHETRGVIVKFDGAQAFVGSTAFGDGTFNDQFGNSYPVDAGLIGCVPLSIIDVDRLSDVNDLGVMVACTDPFEVSCIDGVFNIAGKIIDTRFDDDEEPEWDGQPDEAQEWYDFDPDC